MDKRVITAILFDLAFRATWLVLVIGCIHFIMRGHA